MPTTSNFGWTTPADTDLVKDGAAAIRTLGNGIDTSLVDLKGGTTGQNLRKASNTDLDFTFAGDATNTVVDAAGDLLYGTAADTLGRLAIGTAGQVLKVNSGATAPEWGAAGSSFVGCALTKSVSQTISNNTYTAISFDVEGIDTDAFHDNVTNNSRITIPSGKGGKYLVTGTLTFANNGTGARDAWLVKNGNVGSGGTVLTASIGIPNANNATQHYFNFVVSLVATDFIVLNVYQSSGGNLDILGNSTNAGQSTFCATYLGA